MSSDKKKEEKKSKKEIVEEAAEELSESSSEEEELALLGFFELKKGPKADFKPVYGIVSSGSLFWYKDSRDKLPAGSLGLKSHTLTVDAEGQKKEFVLELKGTDVYYMAFSSAVDKAKWASTLIDAAAKDEAAAPPARDGSAKKKKEGIGARAKKKMATDFATSGLGKKVMKTVLNEESLSLLTAMKRIVAKTDSKKKAEELEKNIIKLMVKGYLLVDSGKIEPDAFLQADKPVRAAFELLARCYKNRGRAKHEVLVEALGRVEKLLSDGERIITELLQPHLKPKNMFRLASTFGYLGSQKFLEKAFSDEELDEELEKLIDAMEYYTQFHF